MQEENNKPARLSECPSAEVMQQYLSGSLNDKEKNVLERHALECELCNDAMIGFGDSMNLDLLSENKNLKKRIDAYFPVKKVKREHIAVWAAAASVILIIGATIVLFFTNNKKQDTLAINHENLPNPEEKFMKQKGLPSVHPEKIMPPGAEISNNDQPSAAPVEAPPSAAPQLLADIPEKNSRRNAAAAPAAKEVSQYDQHLEAVSEISSHAEMAMTEEESDKKEDVKTNMLAIAEIKINDRYNKVVAQPIIQAADIPKNRNSTFQKKSMDRADSVFPGDHKKSLTSSKALENARDSYLNHNFTQAEQLLQALLNKNTGDEQVIMLAILTKLQLGKDQEGLALANGVAAKDSSLTALNQWLKAIALLRLDQAQSKKLLEELAQGNSVFKNDARRFLLLLK